jgi:hypothetical protein
MVVFGVGTAKTTTATAIAVLLGRAGVPVPPFDMDRQANLTTAFGLSARGGLYRAMSLRDPLPVDSLAESPPWLACSAASPGTWRFLRELDTSARPRTESQPHRSTFLLGVRQI